MYAGVYTYMHAYIGMYVCMCTNVFIFYFMQPFNFDLCFLFSFIFIFFFCVFGLFIFTLSLSLLSNLYFFVLLLLLLLFCFQFSLKSNAFNFISRFCFYALVIWFVKFYQNMLLLLYVSISNKRREKEGARMRTSQLERVLVCACF